MPNVNAAGVVMDGGDEPVFVPADVEDDERPILIDPFAEIGFHIVVGFPFRVGDKPTAVGQRHLGVGMDCPEKSKHFGGNNTHGASVSFVTAASMRYVFGEISFLTPIR
jgi:hypothetical protein